MRDLILQSQHGGAIVVTICLLILLAALLCLFNDEQVRRVGLLSVLLFGVSFLGALTVLEILDIELPRWMQGRRRGGYGTIIVLLWMYASYKLADWLYYRHLC